MNDIHGGGGRRRNRRSSLQRRRACCRLSWCHHVLLRKRMSDTVLLQSRHRNVSQLRRLNPAPSAKNNHADSVLNNLGSAGLGAEPCGSQTEHLGVKQR
jgi:hypothetical protein